MKKRLCLILIFVVLMAAFTVNAFAASSKSFPDVKKNDWFYDDVTSLQSAGVIDGFPDGTFRPSEKVTTGQALKMVLLASGHPEPEPVSSHWARGYLNYALEQGFLTRYQDISDLDVTISRALVAKLAARALYLERSLKRDPFLDSDSDDVCALYEADILRGYEDGTIRPNNGLTRAELSAIVNRIYQYRMELEADDPDETEVTDINLRTTEQGLSFIKSQEGFVKYAMWDYSQYSIGYGTRCDKDEYPEGITTEEADLKLREFLSGYEEKLNAFEKKNGLSFNANEYDALMSLSYNIGTSWMDGSRLSRLLTGGYDANSFASAFGIWCHVTENGKTVIHDILVSRRIREIRIFLYGDYTGKASKDFCAVRFQTEEGSLDVDIAFYQKGSKFSPTHDASSSQYDFLGWQASDGTIMTSSSVINQNMTLTALWDIPDEPEDSDPDEDDPGWEEWEDDDWYDFDDWFFM